MKLPLEEVFLSNTEKSYQYHVWQKEGKIRKISSKLFTTNMLDTIDNIVRRNLWEIVSLLYPQAIISDRTALELKPATDGSIFVISDKRRPTTIGYITIKPRQGQKPTDGDKTFMGKLHLPSTERALLENARITRTPKGEISRCFSKSELEEYLDQTLSRYGEKSLNKIRDSMRKISQELGMDEEFIKINNIIGSLLQTHESPLQSKVAIARSTGHGYDMKRIELFHKLAREIEKYVPTIRYNKLSHLDNLYFYEAYFSNYIEGTKFEVEEAKDIVFNNKIPQNRPNDAHDILGTFKVVSSNELMKARYSNFADFIDSLKKRHAILMGSRTEKHPGELKKQKNQAGTTIFVNPENVIGTLEQGFDIYKTIDTAFGRAVFMMFMISEIHPFDDGNGRTGRVMMNAELVANNEQRIIIPTIYRNNYLSALRALTNSGNVEAILKVLDFAQKYTNMINWEDFNDATKILDETHAFMDANQAEEEGLRLVLPR